MESFSKLVEIMARLRTPQTGCPWDIEQDFSTIAPYTVEEAYEVADAIERNDLQALKSELGDLLFQVVFHARMAEEMGAFTVEDVVAAISQKMVDRHPHVFGDADIADADAQTENWEKLKAKERAERGQAGVLDDVPRALPALLRAEKLSKRAARGGFDWPEIDQVYDKLDEEIDELKQARSKEEQVEELGDVLFCIANLARKMGLDPEAALQATNNKFRRRFEYVESALKAEGSSVEDADLDEMEEHWNAIRRADKASD
jgi:MazG family protein